jgi:hypothetical protein
LNERNYLELSKGEIKKKRKCQSDVNVEEYNIRQIKDMK